MVFGIHSPRQVEYAASGYFLMRTIPGATIMQRVFASLLVAITTGLTPIPIIWAQECPRPRGCLYPGPPEITHRLYPSYLGAPTACLMPEFNDPHGYACRPNCIGTPFNSGNYYNGRACGMGLRRWSTNPGCSTTCCDIVRPAYGAPAPFNSARPLALPAPAVQAFPPSPVENPPVGIGK